MPENDKLSKSRRVVIDYHERTKHRLDRPAASLGYMDWANQPDPFRSFAGARQIALPFPELRTRPTYDGLFIRNVASAPLDAGFIGRLFYHSLALSAWKQAPGTQPWSLRINPSSGDLHPTEGYLAAGPVPGLIESPGIFHYDPYTHRLECRRVLSPRQWSRLTEGLPPACLLIGLTSIHWRESWKYGERAFRYCHHDVGHAIGAITVASRTLGWRTQMLDTIADDDLNRLLGTHLQTGIEAEHADCLLALHPDDSGAVSASQPAISFKQWQARIPDGEFAGTPNRLSREHQRWPVIAQVAQAAVRIPDDGLFQVQMSPPAGPAPENRIPDRQLPAERIIRQRRSAVHMDRTTTLDRRVFFHMLQRVRPGQFPISALPWRPRVSLAVFVHRVVDLPPGLYLYARTGGHESALRQSLRSDFDWQPVDGSPPGLRVYRLLAGDLRRTAKRVSCHQDIAADGAFSLGMLTEFDTIQSMPWHYPRLFWECGLIGQVLYLEAEAAGLRATGIGCFFDDVMHDLLGIAGRAWQSLYHFTVGGPVDDHRLKTIPPYAHMKATPPAGDRLPGRRLAGVSP